VMLEEEASGAGAGPTPMTGQPGGYGRAPMTRQPPAQGVHQQPQQQGGGAQGPGGPWSAGGPGLRPGGAGAEVLGLGPAALQPCCCGCGTHLEAPSCVAGAAQRAGTQRPAAKLTCHLPLPWPPAGLPPSRRPLPPGAADRPPAGAALRAGWCSQLCGGAAHARGGRSLPKPGERQRRPDSLPPCRLRPARSGSTATVAPLPRLRTRACVLHARLSISASTTCSPPPCCVCPPPVAGRPRAAYQAAQAEPRHTRRVQGVPEPGPRRHL
jgi:hypothetical protein